MSVARHHIEWLRLVDASGPFLSMPVLLKVFPDGLDRHEDERQRKARLHVAFGDWQDASGDTAIHRAWVRHVLGDVLEWDDALLLDGQAIPASCSMTLPEHGERLAPDLVLVDPPGRASAGRPRLLVDIVPRGQGLDAALAGHRWKASPATRMMTLLHGAKVRLGLVTNGEQWMLVHATPGDTTSYVSFYASLWFEEPVTLRALASLVGARRLFAVPDGETLEALFAESAAHQHEVTDQLGAQVRRAVEVLVQTIDRLDRDRGRALLTGIGERDLYEAAVAVMMRLVFLFAAEERGLLLLGDPLYDQHYAVSTLREQLQAVADAHGSEVLARRHDAWSRLLATFRAVHGGVDHEAMRLPAYGGSLFDPDRYPFLEGRAPGTRAVDTPAQPLLVDNLTVLDLLNALQLLEVKVPGGGPAETRRLSFRALDVEQIGHVYEGLLDHTAKRATGPVVSLRGAKDREPEIALDELERRRAAGEEKLVEFLAEETGRQPATLKRAFEYKLDEHDARNYVTACDNDGTLYGRVTPWAGLIRRDAHGLPVIIPAGSVYVTEGTARRSTGTHYTPRSLTEPIVQHTLEPLVYDGPAEGAPRERWRLKTAKELLALRVCDLAMGSGAFLVAACRYLAERVVEAWEEAERASGGRLLITPDGELASADPRERALPVDAEERLAIARRFVADRCLYGVDVNPMAVEMAKLSLWLVTLQKDRPFTFVDHALKCGDSLLGVTTVEQLQLFSLREREVQRPFDTIWIEGVVAGAADKRRALEALPSEHHDQIAAKARLHTDADAATRAVRAIGDILIALELRAGDRTYESERAAEGERIRRFLDERDIAGLGVAAREALGARRPFHWAIEFPEVMSRGGFDAIVGNPPFIGGKRISGALGIDYRELLVERIARSQKGHADLVAYFFLRANDVMRKGAHAGLVATNTIAQGDTREVGLDQLVAAGVDIVRAVASRPWPGGAALEVAHVWLRRGEWNGERALDEKPVRAIGPQLVVPGNVQGKPHRLAANADKSFIGSYVLGMGFVLTPEEAQALLENDSRNKDVLFPYLSGEDVNSRADQSPSRWVINFHDWSLERAQTYREIFRIVEERVRPERQRRNDHGDFVLRRPLPERWWQFAEKQSALYSAIKVLERVLVLPLVSKFVNAVSYSPNVVFMHKLCVFPLPRFEDWAVLGSSIHELWARAYSSTLETRLNYAPSDCFETFPFPTVPTRLGESGDRYESHRKSIMFSRNEGLTKTYNRFHAPTETSTDVAELRRLHRDMDNAVAHAYGWADLDLGHGFHETKQGVRYTISEAARRVVLDRLLELNHARYDEEVRAGLHDKKVKAGAATKKKPVAQPMRPVSQNLDLFAAAAGGADGDAPLEVPPGAPILAVEQQAWFFVLGLLDAYSGVVPMLTVGRAFALWADPKFARKNASSGDADAAKAWAARIKDRSVPSGLARHAIETLRDRGGILLDGDLRASQTLVKVNRNTEGLAREPWASFEAKLVRRILDATPAAAVKTLDRSIEKQNRAEGSGKRS